MTKLLRLTCYSSAGISQGEFSIRKDRGHFTIQMKVDSSASSLWVIGLRPVHALSGDSRDISILM